MITRADFAATDIQVKDAVIQAFDHLKKVSPDYVLFLADGEYKPEYKNSNLRLSPYVIDSREDRYKDETRLKFFIKFMQTFYGFPNGMEATTDDEFRLHEELMVYTHIWESKPSLRKMYRFASLCNGENYKWALEVPEMGKHEFIRSDIRDKFRAENLSIADIISKGFHTSLRNAFAHSEYSIDMHNQLVHLDTYKGNNSWDIKNISFDDWSLRFCYSALLSYHLLNEFQSRRASLVNHFGTDTFQIVHPIHERKFRVVSIEYHSEHDSFRFKRP